MQNLNAEVFQNTSNASSNGKKLRCGLIMPISATDIYSEKHWEDVRFIIKEALEETGFEVELVSDSNEIGIIQERIVKNLYNNDIVIRDVSSKNPNVMFELGLRLAFDKPAVIIKDDKTNYSFDTALIEHIGYPSGLNYHAIQMFKRRLREKVVATHEASLRENYTTFLKNFGNFVAAKIDEKPISQDEFILKTMETLRIDMQDMKAAWSASMQFISDNIYFNDVIKRAPSEFYRSIHRPPTKSKENTPEQHLREFIKRNSSPSLLADLKDQNSKSFRNLLDGYIVKYADPTAMTSDRLKAVYRKTFVDLITELQ